MDSDSQSVREAEAVATAGIDQSAVCSADSACKFCRTRSPTDAHVFMGKCDTNGCGGSSSGTALGNLIRLRCTSLKHLVSISSSSSGGRSAHGGGAADSGNGSGAELPAMAALSDALLSGKFSKSSWDLGLNAKECLTMGDAAEASVMKGVSADGENVDFQSVEDDTLSEAAFANPGITSANSQFDTAAAIGAPTPIHAAAAAAAAAATAAAPAGTPSAGDIALEEAVSAFPSSWAAVGPDDGVTSKVLTPTAMSSQFEEPSAAAVIPAAAVTPHGACLAATAAGEEHLSRLAPAFTIGCSIPATKEDSPRDASAAAADVATKAAPSPVSSPSNTTGASPLPQKAAAAAEALPASAVAVECGMLQSQHSAGANVGVGDGSGAPSLFSSDHSASDEVAASVLSATPGVQNGLEEAVASLTSLTPAQLQMLLSLADSEAHPMAASLLANEPEVGLAAAAASGSGCAQLPQQPGKDGPTLEVASPSHDLPDVGNLQCHSDVAVSVHEQTEWMPPSSAYPAPGVADVAVTSSGAPTVSAAPSPTVGARRHFPPLKPLQIERAVPAHNGAAPLSYVAGSQENCTSALLAKSAPAAGAAPGAAAESAAIAPAAATTGTTIPMSGLLGSPVPMSLTKVKHPGLLRPGHRIGTGASFSLLRTSLSAASQRSSLITTPRASLLTTTAVELPALATSPLSGLKSPMAENVPPILLKKPGSGTSPAWQIALKNHHRQLQAQVRQQQQQQQQHFYQELEQPGEGAVALSQEKDIPQVKMGSTLDRAATSPPTAMSPSLFHELSIDDAEGNGTPCPVVPGATFDLARLARALQHSYDCPSQSHSPFVPETSSGALQTPLAATGESGLSAAAGAASLAGAAPHFSLEVANNSGTCVSLRNKRKWLPHTRDSTDKPASDWGVSSPLTSASRGNRERGVATTRPQATLWDCLTQISSGHNGGNDSQSRQGSVNALDSPVFSVAPEPFSLRKVADPDVHDEHERQQQKQKQEQKQQPQLQQQKRNFHVRKVSQMPQDLMAGSVIEQPVQEQQKQQQHHQQQQEWQQKQLVMLPPPEQQQRLHQLQQLQTKQQNRHVQRLLRARKLVRNLDAVVPETPLTKKARLSSPVVPKVRRATVECDDVDLDGLLWEDDHEPAGGTGVRGHAMDGSEASDPNLASSIIRTVSRQLSSGGDAAASGSAAAREEAEGGTDEALIPADDSIKPKSLLEKRRRARIRDKLEQLQAILPESEVGMGRTVDVLKAAILHIKSLEARLKRDQMR